MEKGKQTVLNVICSTAVLATNILVGFFLSPFIVEQIGVEANGFVTLANNFTAYAGVVVTALNSMAARFITLSYVQKDYKKANLYYNSVFWGNLLLAAVFLVPAVYLTVSLEKVVELPAALAPDVKWMFALVFCNFFLYTCAPNWDCGTYITNRMDRYYIPSVVAALFRCAFLYAVFRLFPPYVWYVGLASLLHGAVTIAANGWNTHKLTPELRVPLRKGKRICSWAAIRELVGSGMWNSISNVGNMLLSGLDLILCNLALGATAMGVLSLSKILPNYIQQFAAAIRGAFAPEMTIHYAKGDTEAIYRDICRAMKLMSVLMTVPTAGIAVLGEEFFALWVPSQDAALLQRLSLLAIWGYLFTGGTQVLHNVFETVNKVKQNAVSMLVSGTVSIGLTGLLIWLTDWDLYAVAGVSTLVTFLRNMLFTVPMSAKYLGLRWTRFFPQVFITAASSAAMIALGLWVKRFLPVGSWPHFFGAALAVGGIGLVVSVGIVLNREDKQMIAKKLRGLVRQK